MNSLYIHYLKLLDRQKSGEKRPLQVSQKLNKQLLEPSYYHPIFFVVTPSKLCQTGHDLLDEQYPKHAEKALPTQKLPDEFNLQANEGRGSRNKT